MQRQKGKEGEWLLAGMSSIKCNFDALPTASGSTRDLWKENWAPLLMLDSYPIYGLRSLDLNQKVIER